MEQIKNLISRYVNQPDALVVAKKELENAKRAFLQAKTHTEYYSSLADFESVRITRLEKYLKDAEKTK